MEILKQFNFIVLVFLEHLENTTKLQSIDMRPNASPTKHRKNIRNKNG